MIPMAKRIVKIHPSWVTNVDFLKGIFGVHWRHAHVCTFRQDPAGTGGNTRRLWVGDIAGNKLESLLNNSLNTYFVVSLFTPLTEEQCREQNVNNPHRRRKDLFAAQYVLVIDDVGVGGSAKVNPERLAELGIPEPSWILETSPGNCQWGFIFTEPERNRHRAEALVSGLVALGITEDNKDPGMLGATRYVRLPVGSNTKAKYGGDFRCKLLAWDPERTYSVDNLAQRLGVSLESADAMDGSLMDLDIGDLPVLRDMNELGLIKSKPSPGKFDLHCPFADEHSQQPGNTDGAALLIHDDGKVFKCHHGSCEHRGYGDLVGKIGVLMLDEQLRDGTDPFPGMTPEEAEAIDLEVEIEGEGEEEIVASGSKEVPPGDDFPLADEDGGDRELSDREIADNKTQEIVLKRFLFLKDVGDEAAPPEYLVYPLLVRDTFGTMFGESKALKSFVCLNLGLSVATGLPFMGHPTEQAPVLYLAAEGAGGLLPRVVAWKRENAAALSGRPLDFAIFNHPIDLGDESGCERLRKNINRGFRELSGPPQLIIIDTFSASSSVDENDNGAVASLIKDMIKHVRVPFKATVIVVHHTGKANKTTERGAYALRANADFSIFAFREEVPKGAKTDPLRPVLLQAVKVKDGREWGPLRMRPKIVEVGPRDKWGVPYTSLHLEPEDVSNEAQRRGLVDLYPWLEHYLDIAGPVLRARLEDPSIGRQLIAKRYLDNEDLRDKVARLLKTMYEHELLVAAGGLTDAGMRALGILEPDLDNLAVPSPLDDVCED